MFGSWGTGKVKEILKAKEISKEEAFQEQKLKPVWLEPEEPEEKRLQGAADRKSELIRPLRT